MKTAWMKAGLKIVLGFAFVGALIGIRIVSLTPNRVEAEIAPLEYPQPAVLSETSRVAREAAALSAVPGPVASETNRQSSRQTVRPFERAPSPREGDRMVSCRLAGGTQFMRGDDCAMRGGRSTPLDSRR